MADIKSCESAYLDALNTIGVLNWAEGDTGEERFLRSYLSSTEQPVVFDVGAHHGNYALKVLSICSSAQLFAFEPHPVSFGKLSEAGKKDGFSVFQCGLGSAEGTSLLYDYDNDDGSEHATLFKDVIEDIFTSSSTSHVVHVRKLDDIIEELHIAKINLLKVDTEGNELDVLRGAERSIRSGKIDVIQFEFNEMNVISRTFFKDFFDFLPEYDFFRLTREGAIHLKTYRPWLCEIFAFQNIVCVLKANMEPHASGAMS